MPSKDRFTDINVPNSTDSSFVCSNGFFTAIPWKAGGGGQIAVMKVEDYTKFNINDPMIKGHTGPIADFEFNPFIDNLLGTASEDGTVALWTIPVEGLTEDLKTPNATLYGHSKKLTHLRFNPSAENVLASASFDKDVRIWDAYRGKSAGIISGLIGQPTSLEWNYDGSLLSVCDKNKKLHVFDPRDTTSAVFNATAHEGPKQLKCCWLGESNRILTTGISKQMFKEIAIWDSRDLSQPLIRKKADKNIEVSDPFFDPVNNLVYLAVKGEARVNIWEVTNDEEMLYQVATFKGEGSHRGFNFLPKRFVDVMSSELMRAVRLTDKFCEYVSFRLPKKKGAFVSSLYGQCPNGEFSKTFEQWMDGESAPPPTVSLDPEVSATLKLRVHDGSFPVESSEEVKTSETEIVTVASSSSAGQQLSSSGRGPASVNVDVEEIKQTYERKISELEEKLNNLDVESAQPASSNEEVETLKSENEELSNRIVELQQHVTDLERDLKLRDQEIEDLKRVRDEKLQQEEAE